MSDLVKTLIAEFERVQNPERASFQKAYLRNQFEFYGLDATARREIQKPFLLRAYLPPKAKLTQIVEELWGKPQRECQHFAMELVFKYVKQLEKTDMSILEFMVINKSWWDTVDYIATKLMGAYFTLYPELRREYVNKWLASGNIWLQRSALLFQLKYKKAVDSELMSDTIHQLLGSKEFFINKAIGWVLREYSKTNPEWVIAFEKSTNLSNLSKKEALRLIKK